MSDHNQNNQYARAGVDIDSGQRAVQLMKTAVQATYTPQVLSDTGNFGGLYALDNLSTLSAPILVASTDGVGTKTKIASALNRWDSIGQDLVNHCINDILVQGARPLFFLDYVASSQLVPEQISAIVTGMAHACQQAECALLGGETAEMPGVYVAGEVDVVGTIVGVVDRAHLLDGSQIKAGDVIFGLPSTGLHTNGYSLARAVLADADLDAHDEQLGTTLGDALLAVHRNYQHPIADVRESGITINGLAHITGGGLIDNIPRILPDETCAVIDSDRWHIPPLFQLIEDRGAVNRDEMYRVFNMGVGMVVIVPEEHADALQHTCAEAFRIGTIERGTPRVIIR
ncbi:MAG: phosphoribosylformylglycinamidine cyclo-ligase [Anaerolineae bacterium]